MSRVRTVEHVADVRRRPGVQRDVLRALPASVLGPLATTAAAVPADSDVVLDGVVEATGADVVLTGTVAFRWEGECRRCLEPVAGETVADLREVFAPVEVEGETWPIDGDAIDLGPVVREVVLLSLPMVPLCAEDCAGPDPARFPATVELEGTTGGDEGDVEAEPPPRDPRWAALDDLRFD